MRRRRGSSMLEGALVIATFVYLMVGVTDFGRLGFAYCSITYAAHQAARWASTNGSASGHAATAAAIESNAENALVGLNSATLTVTATWNPTNNNNPGSQVQVVVSYGFKPLLVPIASTTLTLKSTAVDVIIQ